MTFTDKAAGELRAAAACARGGGRARLDLPLGGARAAPPLRGRPGPDPPLEGARSCAGSATRCRARTASGPPAISRRRSSGRRTGASRPRRTATGSATTSRRSRPTSSLRVFREYERRKAAEGLLDFEDLLERTARLLESDERSARGGARALACVHRRRVPGRQPPPAVAARSLARRAGRPLRGRRRLPGDLRLHGRERRVAARAAAAFPARARSCGSSGTTARRRRCSSSRTGSCRGSAARRRRSRRRCRTGRSRSSAPALSVVAHVRQLHAERAAARGDGGARADERPDERVRGGVPRRGDPVPGRVAARARRGAPAAEGAARPAWAGGRGRARARRPSRVSSRSCRRSSASASRHGRPIWRGSSGSRRSSTARSTDFVGAAPRALRRERRSRRPPADAPPREGARVGGRLPAARRGGRAAGHARGDVDEERRLFYVGLTRAKRHLLVTWEGKPSRFLDELGVRAAAPPQPKRERPALEQTPDRAGTQASGGSLGRAPTRFPPTSSSTTATLAELVARTPRTLAELAAVPGIGPGEARALRPGAAGPAG